MTDMRNGPDQSRPDRPHDDTPSYRQGVTPAPQVDAAIEFLTRFCPEGPWDLYSIPQTGGAPRHGRFTVAHEPAARAWIQAQNAGCRNIYFGVNPLLRVPKKGKAKKEDVSGLAWIHVDVDPEPVSPACTEQEKRQFLEFEQVRILGLLHDRRPNELPEPTLIVFSGGGYQAYWRLSSILPTQGKLAATGHAEAYSEGVARLLGGDGCFNIDRIMRLPGTVNWPDEAKRSKGRVPALAEVISSNDRTYDLRDFDPVKVEATKAIGAVKSRREAEKPPEDLPRVGADDVRALPISDWHKEIILRGFSESRELQGNDQSPSAWQWAVSCELARNEVSDDLHCAILLNREFGISETIYKKGNGAARRAWKQVRNARREVGRVLVPGRPLVWARLFREDMRPHLIHTDDVFLDWQKGAYVEINDDTIRSEVYAFLDRAKKRVKIEGKPALVPFDPMRRDVTELLAALEAECHVAPHRFRPPCWIHGHTGPAALEIVSFPNGLLHLPTGDVLPPTENFFTRNALEFDYDPEADTPKRWLKFLSEVWPDEEERPCIETLQEMFGYLLIPETSQQKAFLIQGPKRSGKGTIGRILRCLIGERNSCSPSLNSLHHQFGLQSLVGKQLASVSDMRIDRRTEIASISENILRITGEDAVDVNRKFKDPITVILPTRLVILTNQIPEWRDDSGALAGRFVILPMKQSFYGREDPNLTEDLERELPGILNWAIEGWKRLTARGFFQQPEVGEQLRAAMRTPIEAFVADCCRVGPTHSVEKSELYGAYGEWADSEGIPTERQLAKDQFFKRLKEVVTTRPVRPSVNGQRVQLVEGVALRDDLEDPIPF